MSSEKELRRFETLKKKIAQMKSEADKSQGALDEILKRLKKEFGCVTLLEAEVLLKRLKKEEKDTGKAFRIALSRFEKKWKEFLE